MTMTDVPVKNLDWILTNRRQTYFNFSYMRVTSEVHYVRMHVSYFGTIYSLMIRTFLGVLKITYYNT
jgi:hypothetical protein